MREANVKALPAKAFAVGLGKLGERERAKNVVILGFDTEYDSDTQEIVCYQLSDGELSLPKDADPFAMREEDFTHSAILEATEDLTWERLSTWVRECLVKWGYKLREINTILLVSHFSTAELSHVKDFWVEADVRRVSAAQVYNASYRVNDHQRLVVMDNYHFWNVGNNGNASLMAVAEKFGEKKLSYDTTQVSRASLGDARFRIYGIWDAVLCARVFRAFRERLWSDHEIDVIQYPTSASLAMAVYRRHFLPVSLPCPDAKIRRQAWLSLWGGRAEAYQQGDFYGSYTLRDVTSLYPSAERLLKILPRALDWVERNEPISWRGLCRVKFSFPESVRYPCLPVCHDARLIFPLEGVSDCTLDEARVAHHLGAKLDFLKVWEYDTGDSSLTEFMEHFARVKSLCEEKGEDGEYKDAVGRELAKLMMNSLIGKLSQNKGDVDIEDMKKFSQKIGVPLEVCLSPQFFHPEKPRATPRIGGHIMPEWSALILGKARAIMATLLNKVGKSLICSTDSLLIPEELNLLVDEAMREAGVILTNKNGGKITHRVRVVRNRVYAAETEKGELVFGASHAIHLGSRKQGCPECKKGECKHPLHNSLRFILSEETQYTKRKRLGLKTAIRTKGRFFEESEAPMTFQRLWDKKRKLLPSGDSVPWKDVAEYSSHAGLTMRDDD